MWQTYAVAPLLMDIFKTLATGSADRSHGPEDNNFHTFSISVYNKEISLSRTVLLGLGQTSNFS